MMFSFIYKSILPFRNDFQLNMCIVCKIVLRVHVFVLDALGPNFPKSTWSVRGPEYEMTSCI